MSILVPLDTSSVSHLAVPEAARLAAGTGDGILLITVADEATLRSLDQLAAAEDEDPIDILEAKLRSVASSLPGIDVKIDVIAGEDVPAAIVDRAARPDVSTIVLASHGRTGVSRWRMGSVAERVVRSAAVPVMVVPAPWRTKDKEGARPRRVAV